MDEVPSSIDPPGLAPAPSLEDFCSSLGERFRASNRQTSLANIATFPQERDHYITAEQVGDNVNSPLHLSIASINSLMSNLAQQRPHELEELHQWTTDHYNVPYHENDPRWSPAEILKLIHIFSEILLPAKHQLPAPHLTLKFKWTPGLLMSEKKSYAICTHYTNDKIRPGETSVEIEVDPKDYSKSIKVEGYLQYLYSMILHEMCHAYFISYCCDGKHDPQNQCAKDGKALWADGHSLAWFHLACAWERAVEILTLGELKLNLLALNSFSTAMVKGKVRPPAAGEWKRFLADWRGARKVFEKLDAQEAEALGRVLVRDSVAVQLWVDAGREAQVKKHLGVSSKLWRR